MSISFLEVGRNPFLEMGIVKLEELTQVHDTKSNRKISLNGGGVTVKVALISSLCPILVGFHLIELTV